MAKYPYTLNPGNLAKFLERMRSAGVPPKVTRDYLTQAGFKSSNDRAIINILKFIGFVDNSGTTTKDKYENFRNTNEGPKVLANSIRSSYSELFQMYPDAHQKDAEALRNFFSTHTKGGPNVLSAMVSTFKTLCSEAAFDTSAEVPSTEAPKQIRQSKTLTPKGIESLVINIQLTLPATSDGKIYEEFFKAMNKHLLEGKE